MRQAGSLGPGQLLGPLRIVARPVGVGGQVDPGAGVGEAHDAPVRHPRYTGLEVVHDPQCLYGIFALKQQFDGLLIKFALQYSEYVLVRF